MDPLVLLAFKDLQVNLVSLVKQVPRVLVVQWVLLENLVKTVILGNLEDLEREVFLDLRVLVAFLELLVFLDSKE